MGKFSVFIFLFSAWFNQSVAQLDPSKQYQVVQVGFYNLENLFDTIDTPNVIDEEFTPRGAKAWNSEKYFLKLGNMAKVISLMGKSNSPDGIAVLGVCEVENKTVLEDLCKQDAISVCKYEIIHYDSPDHRGVDVGLLYQPRYFKPISSKSITLKIEGDVEFATRDQLLVTGDLLGERVHFMVAHWPSRRGGEKRSSPKREAAARLAYSVIDSICKAEPGAKIIFMGDLNDDPVNKSVKNEMHATGKITDVKEGMMFNAMEDNYKKAIGTLAYRNNWNLFDQMIFTPGFLAKNEDYSALCFYRSVVFNEPFLKQKEGNFEGYPFRTYVGSTFMGGYSDHFPVYSVLVKEIQTK